VKLFPHDDPVIESAHMKPEVLEAWGRFVRTARVPAVVSFEVICGDERCSFTSFLPGHGSGGGTLVNCKPSLTRNPEARAYAGVADGLGKSFSIVRMREGVEDAIWDESVRDWGQSLRAFQVEELMRIGATVTAPRAGSPEDTPAIRELRRMAVTERVPVVAPFRLCLGAGGLDYSGYLPRHGSRNGLLLYCETGREMDERALYEASAAILGMAFAVIPCEQSGLNAEWKMWTF
jgi:hypothetical protein